MSVKGGAYFNFQRALATGNLVLIRAAATELPTVNLGDALAVCMAIRDGEPHRYERAALRWLARFCAERAQSIREVERAVSAFARLPREPEAALRELRALVR